MEHVQVDIIRLQIFKAFRQINPELLGRDAAHLRAGMIVMSALRAQDHLPAVLMLQPAANDLFRPAFLSGDPVVIHMRRIQKIAAMLHEAVQMRMRLILRERCAEVDCAHTQLGNSHLCPVQRAFFHDATLPYQT